MSLACLVMASGCTTSSQLRSVREAVRAELPCAALDREVHVNLGPVSLGLIRGVASLAGDELDDEDARILAALHRVEVDVYAVDTCRSRCPSADRPLTLTRGGRRIDLPRLADLESRLVDQGWAPVITVREDGELSLVLTQEDRQGRIRGMFIVSYDGEELVALRLEGRLDRLLAEAVADDPDALVGIVASGSASSS